MEGIIMSALHKGDDIRMTNTGVEASTFMSSSDGTMLTAVPSLKPFLMYTGNYLPNLCNTLDFNEWLSRLAHWTTFIFIEITFVFLISNAVGEIASSYQFDLHRHNAYLKFAVSLLFLTFCIDVVSVVLVQYLNHVRMGLPPQSLDKVVASDSLHVANLVLFACLLVTLVSIALYVIARTSAWSFRDSIIFICLVAVPGLAFSGTLAFNVYFLILDLKASLLIIDSLHLQADKFSLTMEVFCKARDEIHERVERSRWACDVIIAPCLLSVVTIALFALSGAWESLTGFSLMLSLTRELIFVGTAFWYVAKVNGQADGLTRKLSAIRWQNPPDHTAESASLLEEGTSPAPISDRSSDTNTATIRELERLSIYASAKEQPISFTLLFTRVTWTKVFWSVVGFGVTILTAIIKSIVENGSSG